MIPSGGDVKKTTEYKTTEIESVIWYGIKEEWGSGARKKMADKATVKGQGRRVRYVFREKEMRNPC